MFPKVPKKFDAQLRAQQVDASPPRTTVNNAQLQLQLVFVAQRAATWIPISESLEHSKVYTIVWI